MPFRSKAQQRFMFARHPQIAKRWAKGMEAEHKSIKKLPEKVAAFDALAPAGYWYGRSTVKRLEGGAGGGGERDVPIPKGGFGTLYGTGHPTKGNGATKTAFDLAFSDEVCKIAQGPSRTKSIRLARRAAPVVAKRIRGIRRIFKTLKRVHR